MAFEVQEKEWSCGAAALRYCLSLLGRTVTEKAVRKASGTGHMHGTNEDGLVRAARKFGCTAVPRRFRDFGHASRALLSYLKKDQPCILSVDDEDHWIVVGQGKIKRGRSARAHGILQA